MHLDFRENELSSIDLTKNILLLELYCWDNQLASLNLSQNTELEIVHCWDNLLICIQVYDVYTFEWIKDDATYFSVDPC